MEFLIDRSPSATTCARCRAGSGSSRRCCRRCARVTDPARRDGYLQLLARRCGVDERVLLEALRRPEATAARSAGRRRPTSAPRSTSRPSWPARTRSTRGGRPGARAGGVRRCCACCCCTPVLMRRRSRSSAGPRCFVHARRPASCWQRSSATPPAGFDRAAFVESASSRRSAAVARTLYARRRPAARRRGALAPGARAEPAHPRAQPPRRARSSFKRAELAEAEAAGDADRGRPAPARRPGAPATPARRSTAAARTRSLLAKRRHPTPTHGRTHTGGHP